MAESLHDYMQVGIIHFMAYPECGGGQGPILETFRRLALDPFFDVIEVTQMKDIDVRTQVRDIAQQARVDLVFGAQPILLGGKLDLNHPDEAERKKAVDAVKAAIDQAEYQGCGAVAVLSGPVTEDKDAAIDRLVGSLIELSAYGQPKDLPIVLETFDQVPFGKNCLIGPTEDAVRVSEAVRMEYPEFGLLLDLSHLPLQCETPSHAIRVAGDHLVHVHIGNCAMDDPEHPAYGDNHPRFGAPGTRNDVPQLVEFLRLLLDSGYLRRGHPRTVSFEVKPMAGEDADAVVAGSKRTLEEAWREIEREGYLAALLAAAVASKA